MSDLTNVFTDIADAIRAKTETQITYKPTEMADAINNISGGGALVYDANGVPFNQWFNTPITIAEGVTNTVQLFTDFQSFNQPVNIPSNVTDTASMFTGCASFNQPVTIPNSVIRAYQMFAYCYNLNQPVTISEGVQNTSGLFLLCSNFNQPITIPDSVISMTSMFYECQSFNLPVTIPSNVTNTAQMFSGCHRFNQLVTIPSSVTNVAQMFSNCYNFNQPVTIPNSVTNSSTMFWNCYNFNQPVIISDGVTTTSRMFFNCTNFNQPVTIPSTVTNLVQTFYNCYNFNQSVIIPNSITTATSVFEGCSNIRNVYWYTNVQKTATKNMLSNCNNQLLKRIFTNNTNAFNGTSTTNSITGKAITWTQDGANYYNTAFNIYIHNVTNPYSVLNNADYHSYFADGANSSEVTPAMVFGDAVNNMRMCFSGYSAFDSYVVLGNNIQDMSYAFQSTRFNQPIVIPESVTNVYSMLFDCAYFGSSIIFRNTANLTSESVAYLFRDTDDDKSKTIICDNAQLFISSELFTRPVEWTEIENGVWFNATVNTTIKQI